LQKKQKQQLNELKKTHSIQTKDAKKNQSDTIGKAKKEIDSEKKSTSKKDSKELKDLTEAHKIEVKQVKKQLSGK
jgi:hypothetical protein